MGAIWQRLRFNTSKQRAFLEDIHGLLEDGVSLHLAVNAIAKVYTGTSLMVAESCQQMLSQGQHFADGLQGWYAPGVVALVQAGEQGGTFMQAIKVAEQSLAARASLWTKAAAMLAYPLLVCAMACGVAVFIRHSVLMSFAAIKPVAAWPELGQSLFFWSGLIESYWWLGLGFLVISMASVMVVLRHLSGPVRLVVDQWPLFSLYRRKVAVRVLEILGLMLSNSVSLRRALQLCQQQASPYLRWHLTAMELRLTGGYDNIADVLDTGLLSRQEMIRLRIVAKGRGFAKALLRMSEHADQAVQQQTLLTVRVLSGLLLLLAASFAGLMVLAIYGVGSYIGS